MAFQVMNFINTALSSSSQLFLRIFNGSNMTEIYIAIVFIVLAFRFILSPVFGKSRGSDRVRGSDNE